MSTGKAPNSQDFRILREVAEQLAGKRGDKNKAAMTRGEAKDLREFIAQLRKGTADVQTELKGMVATVTETQQALSILSAGLGDATEGLTAAQQLLATLQSSLGDATDAIEAIATDSADAIGRLEAIKSVVQQVTFEPPEAPAGITAPPTADDFNAMYVDVSRIFVALVAIRNALV